MPRLILGSSSPRRVEILGYTTLPFEQASPPFDEDSIPFGGDPEEYVCDLAKGKAESLQPQFGSAPILAADTVVYCEGIVFGKPKDEGEAFAFLSELCGKWHTVYTGLSLVRGKEEYHEVEGTRVLFNPLTADQIRSYLGKVTWSDKSGGYTIQMSGSLLVRRIEGCYYNILGLPMNAVHALLLNIGIDLWDFVKSH